MNNIFLNEVRERLSLINKMIDKQVILLHRENILSKRDYEILKNTAVSYVEYLAISYTQQLDSNVKEALIIKLVENYEKNINNELFDALIHSLCERSQKIVDQNLDSFSRSDTMHQTNIFKRVLLFNNIKNKFNKEREAYISWFKDYTATNKSIEVRIKALNSALNMFNKKLGSIIASKSFNINDGINKASSHKKDKVNHQSSSEITPTIGDNNINNVSSHEHEKDKVNHQSSSEITTIVNKVTPTIGDNNINNVSSHEHEKDKVNHQSSSEITTIVNKVTPTIGDNNINNVSSHEHEKDKVNHQSSSEITTIFITPPIGDNNINNVSSHEHKKDKVNHQSSSEITAIVNKITSPIDDNNIREKILQLHNLLYNCDIYIHDFLKTIENITSSLEFSALFESNEVSKIEFKTFNDSCIHWQAIAILNELWKNREEEIKEKTWKN
jgi:hypothetical protein